MCLPGHKRLKLTEQALQLTGATRQEPVGADAGKFFADPPAGDWSEPLPLAQLIVLERGEANAITPVSGAERLLCLLADHYTVDLLAAARGRRSDALFQAMAAIAPRIAIKRFVRPHDPARFAQGAAFAAHQVRASHAAGAVRS